MIYEYRCIDCGTQDKRVAGLDDHLAVCVACGALMARTTEDIFQPYFEEDKPCGPATSFTSD